MSEDFVCTTCGETHACLPTDWGYKMPDEFWKLSEQERADRAKFDSDLCMLDDRYFIRCARSPSRRGLFGTTAGAAILAADTRPLAAQPPPAATLNTPIIVCANNGFAYLNRAYTLLAAGADTLEAAVAVVTGPEDDPNDDSVGLGGLPNEEGVVELDACCMHGPTRRAGSVGAVRNIRNGPNRLRKFG